MIRRKPFARLGALVLMTGLAATACSGSSSKPAQSGEPQTPTGLASLVRLRQANSCADLLSTMKAEGEKHVGPYGFGGGGPIALEATADSAVRTTTAAAGKSATDAAAAPAQSGEGGSTDYSTTNVQEAGVDEPDLVKSDGKRIVVLSNGKLTIVDISTGVPQRRGTVGLTDGFLGSEMLISGNRVLVFGDGVFAFDTIAVAPGRGGVASDELPVRSPGATIYEVDIADPTSPTIKGSLEVEGSYLSARMIGNVARVVFNSQTAQLPFVYPQSEKAEAAAKKANLEIIRQSTLSDWLPSYTLRDANGKQLSTGQLADCDQVNVPTQFAGFGSLSILTFDMTKPLGKGDAVSVLTGGQTVYASDTHLYVATTTYVDAGEQTSGIAPDVSANYATSLHQFDISGNAPAEYLASGTVAGHLLNQFAMSEHNGVLRVATTKGAPWNAGTESQIVALAPAGDRLDQIGEVGGMGKGERIYAVRFVDDLAYVVTFRQTDPFYTVDLSDPKNPKVVGELKIPGYSGYLHPISPTLVLGVGQAATDQGRVTGTKVSLFDVSDLSAPKELSTWTLSGSNSQAQFDHHAFLYWPDEKIVVLPIMSYFVGVPEAMSTTAAPATKPASAPFLGAVVLSVDPSDGLKEVGRITHGDDMIMRSLVAANRLVTVSPLKLQARAFGDFTLTGSVDLP